MKNKQITLTELIADIQHAAIFGNPFETIKEFTGMSKDTAKITKAAKELVWEMLQEAGITLPDLADMIQKKQNSKSVEAKKPTVLDKARELVYGAREVDYGPPNKNIQDIANMWNAYFEAIKVRDRVVSSTIRLGNDNIETHFKINAQDVTVMMMLMKIARLAKFQDKEDSLVDIAGYVAVNERLKESN